MSEPRPVFPFSGHMINANGRNTPRFPPEKEPVAANATAAALDDFGAGDRDLGVTEYACGGDLLFAEGLLERGGALVDVLCGDWPGSPLRAWFYAPRGYRRSRGSLSFWLVRNDVLEKGDEFGAGVSWRSLAEDLSGVIVEGGIKCRSQECT
jgi:hypothetical protein